VISKELLDVLACPKCKQRLQLSDDGKWLICQTDRLRYPIVDGIPVMLVEEAESYYVFSSSTRRAGGGREGGLDGPIPRQPRSG
jgi:uncharacterized protein YbaR (Trm112 family)